MTVVPHEDGLYQFTHRAHNHANTTSAKMSISEAHHKLGHIGHAAICHPISKGLITIIDLNMDLKLEFCEPCTKSKATVVLYPKESDNWVEEYGECIHWDLWGPVTIRSLNGHYYATARLDDALHETKVYLQNQKSKTLQSYKNDEVLIENHTQKHIKYFNADQGVEFCSKEFVIHQASKGTIHDSLPHNGISERVMWMWAEQTCALLISSGLPCHLWKEAMTHST